MATVTRASAGYDTHQRVVVRSRVTGVSICKGNSDEHDAKHGVIDEIVDDGRNVK